MSPIRVKQSGALFEQLSSWRGKLELLGCDNEVNMVHFFLITEDDGTQADTTINVPIVVVSSTDEPGEKEG